MRADALPEMVPPRLMAGSARAGPSFPTLGTVRSGLTSGLGLLLLWQQRASQRRHLSRVEDHLLRDVGLTRTEVAREIRKPFWRR